MKLKSINENHNKDIVNHDDKHTLYKFMSGGKATVKRIPGYATIMPHFIEVLGDEIDGLKFISHDYDDGDGSNFDLYKIETYSVTDLFNITDYFGGYTVGWTGWDGNVPPNIIKKMLKFSKDGGQDKELKTEFGYDLGNLMKSIKPGVWSDIYKEAIINVPATMKLVSVPRRYVCGYSGEQEFVDDPSDCDDDNIKKVYMI